MDTKILTYHEDFLELCEHIRQSGIVAFDSEFVSDATYRPELGLLQFATPERCIAVDPLAVTTLSSWWDIMADDTTTVIVHGGQAEIRFCIQQCGQIPRKLVDVQIAEGLRGRSYPLSYSAIVERVLGTRVANSQTRTDWLRRPLSPEQIQYALDDAAYVPEIWERQSKWLESKGRLAWADAEFDRMCQDIFEEERTPPSERVTGIHKLPRRELLVAQRLAKWREEEAAYRNRPPRRILRDDLLIDLAKRRPKTVQQALATRDLNRPEYKKRLEDIVAVIDEACSVSDDQLPPRMRTRDDFSSDEQVIARLLGLALGNVCAELEIAQSLVGTNRDLTELVRSVRNGEMSPVPRLMDGWRGEAFGDLLRNVLDGRVRFRVAPAHSATPLIFEAQE
ncbi:MAG TPA: HRDC domain-containing protein [Planctomycetaceae bacterium]|nr:HRDC domain-containing protein [Planctomycetaceae bacterium]HQZ69337.1 HRDC domain-containing protein [Planctomycetaceae bacterium]